ncbi:MAG: SDR family NAD(P)-dependent oxidoreductase, partial [Chlorobiales bacterium]|nr:SDR family NAD(P)-dependent oxidoreductase [Chlorobiales bacterium]
MRLLILGANSDIALACAARFAKERRADLVLASRNVARLAKKARDLELRFQVKAEAVFFDAQDYDSHPGFWEGLDPKPEAVLLAFGHGGHQGRGSQDFNETRAIVEINYLGAVSILNLIAAEFESRGRGVIMAVSSVAGERGRAANYIYGSAKAGLTTFL